jgi:formylmethanofuran dehydrogenase subunit E
MPYCISCGANIDEYDSAYYARNLLCIPCYNKKISDAAYTTCSRCGIRFRADSAIYKSGKILCSSCANEIERAAYLPVCSLCNQKISYGQQKVHLTLGYAHVACVKKFRPEEFCFVCHTKTTHYEIVNEKIICKGCFSKGKGDFKEKSILSFLLDKLGSFFLQS